MAAHVFTLCRSSDDSSPLIDSQAAAGHSQTIRGDLSQALLEYSQLFSVNWSQVSGAEQKLDFLLNLQVVTSHM